MRFVSNVIWLTLMLCTTLKPNGKFSASNALNASVFTEVAVSCLAIYIILYSSLHSLQIKKNGNITVKNYLKESLLSILCFIIHGKGSSEKGLFLNCQKFI